MRIFLDNFHQCVKYTSQIIRHQSESRREENFTDQNLFFFSYLYTEWDDSRHGGGGNNGAGSGGIGVRHGIGGGEGGGGVTGSQWIQWGGVERGGDGVKRQTKLSTT